MTPGPGIDRTEGGGADRPLPSAVVVPVVTRGGLEDARALDSGDAIRVAGVSIQHTPATRLWFGKVRNEPGFRSVAHHHGEAETGGYVLSGKARIYFGDNFVDYVDMAAGDWVFVPPLLPHIECNLSRSSPLVWVTTRTPDNIVVNLPDVPDAGLRDWLDR